MLRAGVKCSSRIAPRSRNSGTDYLLVPLQSPGFWNAFSEVLRPARSITIIRNSTTPRFAEAIMSVADTLLPEFDQEMATTRRLLERVPSDKGK